MSKVSDKERLDRGYAMMDAVYGAGASTPVIDLEGAFIDETVAHLFGEIWARPHLTIRERRLLVIGASAAMGRQDLIEIQVRGALANNELSDEQLDETVLMLAFYAGWGNGSSVWRGIAAAKAAHAEAVKAEKREADRSAADQVFSPGI